MDFETSETYTIEIPEQVLSWDNGTPHVFTIKPLTVQAFQLIAKAAKADQSLIPIFIVRETVIEPSLSVQQIKNMKVGLVNFLISEIKRVSGIT